MAESSTSAQRERVPFAPEELMAGRSIEDEDGVETSALLVSSGHTSQETESQVTRQEQEQEQNEMSSLHVTPRHPSLPDLKRDSGIDASFTTNVPAPDTQSERPGRSPRTVHDLTQPIIAVQNAQARPGNTDSSGVEEQSANLITRIGSFKGIEPASILGDISLGDLASDRVAFSNRGSLLYAGKRMNEAASTDMNGSAELRQTVDGTMQSKEVKTEAEKPAVSSSSLPTPSPSSRVLSVEEMTFSTRVRSMYEHGGERAASWNTPTLNGISENGDEESRNRDANTPEPTSNGIVVEKTTPATAGEQSTAQSSSPKKRPSFSKDMNEFAGGIEDWEDIDGQDVDRYGFINPKRISSRSSTGDQAPNDGLQRVATRLKVEGNRVRKNGRAGSTAGRSSQSLPLAGQRGSPSIYSTRTHQTGVNSPTQMFRSKDRRAVSHASDMLTLPPGLAQIAEQADGGRTASALKRKERAREEKWQNMAKDNSHRRNTTSKGGGMRFEFDTSDPKLVSRTWKGIPDRWRATAWHSFLSSSARKRNIGASDDELMQQYHKLQEEGSADDVQIDMDVPRTISLHVMFRRRYRGGQRLLFRVLHAISLYFPETGYVQGMASLAATLLCYFEEETAFVMMVRLWQLRGLEQLFAPGFSGLMKALSDFERDWLSHGDVAKKLDDLGVSSTAYGTRWYLTLFNMSIPFPAQLRVWDVFMLLGDATGPKARENGFGGADLDVLHATSAALVDATREIILDSDFENAMKVLTSFVPVKDEDLLMRVAKAEWKGRKKRG